MRSFVAACLVVVAHIASAANPQDATPRAMIRAESRLFQVDTVIKDKKGNAVRDLTQKEFRVWEDYKEQEVVSASFEQVGPAGEGLAPIVLLFDNTSIEAAGQMETKEAVNRFLSSQEARGQAIAVAAYTGSLHMTQTFTSDSERLRTAVKNVPLVARVTPRSDSAPFGRTGPIDPAVAGGVWTVPGSVSADSQTARAFLSSLAAFANSLAAVPGRKALVIFTGGFSIPGQGGQELAAAINACNSANVAVYPVDVRGVEGAANGSSGGALAALAGRVGAAFALPPLVLMAQNSGSVGTSSSQSMGDPALLHDARMDSRQVLLALATNTGGYYIRGTNNLLPDLSRVAGEQSEHYEVGYAPAGPLRDGCHFLRVVVARGGLEVRSRGSYCYKKPPDLLAGTPAERDLETRMNAPSAAAGAAPIQAPFFYTGPNSARVHLTLSLPSAGIQFEKDGAKFHAEVNILALAYKGGDVAARFSDVAKVDLDSKQAADAFALKPFRYEGQFELLPGEYRLKLAYGQSKGSLGSLEYPLVLDEYDGRNVAISAMALCREARQAPEADPALQLAKLAGRSVLLARGILYTPAGGTRFEQGEAVRVYVEVYDPRLLTGMPEIKLGLIVTNSKTGGQVAQAEFGNVANLARPGTDLIPLGFTVPAQPAGEYRIELRAAGAGHTASRVMDFEVE